MKRLTDNQKEYVERNHGLIYWFISKNNLNVDEWYGILAESLCNASISYRPDISKFKTYALKVMHNDYLCHVKDKNDFTEITYDEILDLSYNIESHSITRIELKNCLSKLNDRQFFIIQKIALGYSQSEISDMMGCSQSYISKALLKIKEEMIK